MSTQAFYNWIRLGRNWRAAKPVTELRSAVIAQLGVGVAPYLGTIGDEAHLKSKYPQDHAPFSYTAWPVTLPGYVVCALDISHQPARGLNCHQIFDTTLAKARKGLTPWLKYIIWQGRIYDVRGMWEPKVASGHYDHMHLSIRSDWVDRSTGGFNLLGETDVELDDVVYTAQPNNASGVPAGPRTVASILQALDARSAVLHYQRYAAILDRIDKDHPDIVDLTAAQMEFIAKRLAELAPDVMPIGGTFTVTPEPPGVGA